MTKRNIAKLEAFIKKVRGLFDTAKQLSEEHDALFPLWEKGRDKIIVYPDEWTQCGLNLEETKHWADKACTYLAIAITIAEKERRSNHE